MANFEVYVDPETGDEYSADEIDAINPGLKYESEPEDSWFWRTGMRIGGGLAETAGNMFGGGLEFAADRFPNNSLTDYLEEKGRTARQTGQRINQIQESMGEIDRSSLRGKVSDVLSKGVGAAVPMIPAIMSGPLASGAYFGAQTLGREYGGVLDEAKAAEAQSAGSARGLIEPGNIDLWNRPSVENDDGTQSTVRSISVNVDGKEYLIPTVSDDGRLLSDEQAIDQFRQTGAHLGAFGSPEDATSYANTLHERQAGQAKLKAKARNVAFERAGFDALSGMLLPKGAGAATERTAANYAFSIPRTAGTLGLISAATGANQELSDQLLLQERPLEEVDFDKAAVAAADTLQGGLEDTLGLAAILGPLGARLGKKGPAREEKPTTPFGEFVDRSSPDSSFPPPDFETKGEPYTPGLAPAAQESTLGQKLAEAYSRKAATQGEAAAAFMPRFDMAEAAPEALRSGAPFVPDTLPAVQAPTLGEMLTQAYAKRVGSLGEEAAAFMPRADMPAPVPAVIPESPVSPEALTRSYGKTAARYGEEGAQRLTNLVSPNDPNLDSWLPEPYKPPAIDPKKAVPEVRYSKPVADSSFPAPVKAAISENIASLSKVIPSSGKSGETNSQPPSLDMSLGEIITPVPERTPANSPGLTREGTNQAVSPVSELRNVPERSIAPDLLEGKPVDFTVKAAPRSSVVARPDIMQHREGADPVSGAHKSRRIEADSYDRIKAGPLLVWEPVDPAAHGLDASKGEQYIVGNGHNRLEFANRVDAPIVDIQVLREADGFSAGDVRQMAAEQNIANDNASFVDQVKFFRESDKKLGRDAALARAQSLGAKGRNARTVAFDGSDLLIREVTREAIDEKSAAVLAIAAPRDEAAQGRALEMMRKGETAQTATAFARLSQNAELIDAVRSSGPVESQGSMFGADGEVMRLARLVEGIRKSYGELIGANRAALRARSKGLDVAEGLTVDKASEDIAARLDELKSGADIVDAIEKNTGVRNHALKLLREKVGDSEIIKSVADFLAKLNGNESGAIANPAQAIAGAAKTIQDKLANAYDSITRKSEKGLNKQQLDPSEVWMRGLVGDRHVPGLGFWRKTMSRMQVLMTKHPVAKEIWQQNQEKIEYRNRLMADFQRELMPFYDTIDNKKVGGALASARERAKEARKEGKQLVVTDEHLRAQGLNDHEVAAYRSATNAMNKMWKFVEDTLREDLTARHTGDPDPSVLQKRLAELDNFAENKRQEHYFPIHRFGDFFAFGENPETGEKWYNLFKTRREAAAAARNLKERGFQERFGEIRSVQEAAYAHMPSDLAVSLQALTNGKFSKEMPIDGFKAHLVEAKMVQGYEADLKRNVSEYATSLARWAANLKFDRAQEERLKSIDNRNPIFNEVSEFLEANKRIEREFQGVRALMSVEALGLVPSSAALNLTQAATVTYPELYRLTKNPAKYMAIATRKAVLLSRNPEQFAKRYPELFRDMQYAADSGQLDTSWFGENPEMQEQTRWGKVSDFSLHWFKFADRWTRTVSFIAAHDAAPNLGEKYKFSRDFVTRSNFDYSMQNKPKVARGWGSVFYLFKQYGQNYYGNIKEALEEFGHQTVKGLGAKAVGDRVAAKSAFAKMRTEGGVLLRYAAPMWLLGGYKAAPFVREMISIFAAFGYDLDEKIRELFGENQDLASVAMYGPTILGGVQLSGALSAEMLPMDKGVLGGVAQATLGYPLSYVKRGERALQSYQTYGDLSRAATELAPRAIRNPVTALRWQTDGAALDTKGRAVMQDPTLSESALKALGFNPSRYALAQEQSRRVQKVEERVTNESAGLRNQIAVALEQGDKARALELLRRAQDIGVNVTPKQVQEQMRKNASPEYRQLKSVPKRARKDVVKIIDPTR